MLTPQDLELLKEVVATKEDLEHLASQESVNRLQTSVDSLAKMVKDFRDEHVVIHHRLQVLESWAKEVSQKFSIPIPQ